MTAFYLRWAFVLSSHAFAFAGLFTTAAHAAEPLVWQSDYSAAYTEAAQAKELLVLYFFDAANARVNGAFEKDTLTDAKVSELLAPLVRVRLPLDATVTVAGEESKLLTHGAFEEMLGRPGIAIIDLEHTEAPYFERVVSVLPFTPEHVPTPASLTTLLTLPPGTLTQRTLTYAVRVHPEAPQSTGGEMLPVLATEAEEASGYQARINVQGHHNWGSRFHRINRRLPRGHLSQEVCAESWRGQRMVESAHELVHSWRQSSGHWAAVSRAQPYFGYDMKQGSNGVWYGTGIFGNGGS